MPRYWRFTSTPVTLLRDRGVHVLEAVAGRAAEQEHAVGLRRERRPPGTRRRGGRAGPRPPAPCASRSRTRGRRSTGSGCSCPVYPTRNPAAAARGVAREACVTVLACWSRNPSLDADVEAALDLFAAVAAEGRWLATEAPFDRAEVRARWADLVATGEGTILVAVDEGGAPVGLAAMVGSVRAGAGDARPGRSAPPGRRRRARRACVAWARGSGARRVVLHVFPHNAAAIALYRKHGFEERGVVRAGYPRRSGERWDAIRMVLELGPQAGGSASSR